MKKLSLCAIAAIAWIVFAGCIIRVESPQSVSDSNLQFTTNVTRQAVIPAGIKFLEVDNRYGAVRISGSDTAPAGWSQNLTIRARNEELAERTAVQASCRAELDGDHLKLIVLPLDSKELHHFQSDLEIVAPRSVTVHARNHYGPISISELNGDVEVTGQSGSVEVRNVRGSVRAQNSYATLEVSHTGPATLRNQSGSIQAIGINGPLEAETSYATLVARDVNGKVCLRNQSGRIEAGNTGAADIKTSYATLQVKGVKGDATLVNQSGSVDASDIAGSVNAKTSYAKMDIAGNGSDFVCNNQSGSIRLLATSTTLTNLEATTSYAALEVRLPAGLKPTVQAHTSYADIESDFPVLMKPASRPVSDQEPGAPRVNLQNQSGKIRIVRE